MLLHGNAHDRQDYAAVVPALALELTTFAVDWPGCGESPPAPRAASAYGLAALLPDIVTGLGAAPAIIICRTPSVPGRWRASLRSTGHGAPRR